MNGERRTPLALTDQALYEVQDIAAYSVAAWGRRVADKYIADITAALMRIASQPDLLCCEPELHPAFRCYRVNKHLVVCDVQPHSIVVITIVHASRNVANRLAELSPSLSLEVEMLHRQLADDQPG